MVLEILNMKFESIKSITDRHGRTPEDIEQAFMHEVEESNHAPSNI